MVTEGTLLSNEQPQQFTLCLIAQSGRLEFEAALLCASIKELSDNLCDVIVAIPWSPDGSTLPDKLTLDFISALGFQTFEFKNPVAIREDFAHPYPHSNKMFAMELGSKAERLFFLDSDIIINSNFPGFLKDARCSLPLSLRYKVFAEEQHDGDFWANFYRKLNVPLPCERRRCPLSEEKDTTYFFAPPLFTAHFIGVERKKLSTLLGLWREIYETILKDKLYHHRDGHPRHCCDEVALSVAIHKSGLHYEAVGDLHRYLFHYQFLRKLTDPPEYILPEYNPIVELVEKYPVLCDIFERIKGSILKNTYLSAESVALFTPEKSLY